MKKSMKFATALAGAAVVVVGGSAFTAANTGLNATPIVGYAQNTATGAVITNQEFALAADGISVKSVNFTSSSQVETATHTVKLVITTHPDAEDVDTVYACTSVWTTTSAIACPVSPVVTAEAIKKTSITVVEK